MVAKTWYSYAWTPLVALIGGAFATFVHWPLPWMIGALVAVVLVRCFTPWQIQATPGGRKFGQWIVGVGIGLHFNVYVMEQVLENLAPIVVGSLITTAVGGVAVWLMRAGGEQPATAYFSSMPGGSAEMVNLAQRNGGILHRVAAAQTLRVLIIVLTVPALFKFFVGTPEISPAYGSLDWSWLLILFPLGGFTGWWFQRLRKPNPWMFGPLLLSGTCSVIFDLHLRLPIGASEFGQLMIGSSLGCYFDRTFFKEAPVFLARSFIATCLMVLTAFLAAFGLGWTTAVDFRSLTLGMMPGGLAEMCLTAETLHLAVPVVTAMQTLRLLFVLFLAEPVFLMWVKRTTSP
ncbi:AbrB family transcriptional regulator [Pseudomonas coleopterorum]|uniref:AbrB family transcriptional regulator n=1 Tax=Pseudomonas coleopterorum TaxID=1605838 RepID=A0AAJ6M212_9PSED|nr:AbrB family transcriptional regulator [Pseudomonas coleopterorum]WNC10921.1 AbrB family transcriptional regulator [Pseudomonas coleopterorum]